MEMNSKSLSWWTKARPHMEALTTTMEFLLTDNSSSGGQEIPCNLCNPRGHTVPTTACQMPLPEPNQPSHALPAYFFKIHYNIILPSIPRSIVVSLLYPHHNPI